jgi:hypothetical protein
MVVTGQAVPFECNVTVAGSLKESLPANKENIYEVTLQGYLNAADFAALSGLTNLRTLDISKVYIEGGEIPDNTFSGKSLLVEVLFPEEGLTVIGAGAFAETGLSGTLVLPPSLVTLRGVDDNTPSATKGVFENCSHLLEINFGAKLENIGSRAFSGCTGLTGPLVLPSGLKVIEAMAFYRCSGLTGPLVLPAGVHTLGYPTGKAEGGVFEGCAGLNGLMLSEQLQTLGNGAFKDCGRIEGEILLTPKVANIGDSMATSGVFENCRRVSRVMFTNNVKVIGRFAFSGCESLSDAGALQLPANLEYIGEGAFFRCRNLQRALSIPSKVHTIGTYGDAERGAFEGCNFTSISFGSESDLRVIGGRTFSGTKLAGALNLPAKLESIGEMAFYNCSLTGTLVIPDNVTHIGGVSGVPNGVFEHCAFTGLQLGRRVQVIGRKAFAGTKLAGTLPLPASLQIVGGGAFYGCTGLTGKLTIPNSVHTIEGFSQYVEVGAFEGTSFEELDLGNGSLSYIGERAFYGSEKLAGRLTLPFALTHIGDGAFFGCSHLKGLLIIPSQVRSIGSISSTQEDDKPGVFEGCIGFVGLKIGMRVDTIGDRSFFGCIRLKDNVYIPRTTVTGRNVGLTSLIRTDFLSSYVSPEGDDNHDGSSWKKAFKTIGKALEVAQERNGILYLREGVYEEEVSTPIYNHYFEIIGGFIGTEAIGTEPKGDISVLLNNTAATTLRFTGTNKSIVFLRKLSIKGIDAHCPLVIHVEEDVEVSGKLMLRQETSFTGEVTVSGEICALQPLSFQGTLTLNEATLNPQESLPFRTDSLVLKKPSRINVSGQGTDHFLVMEVPSEISNLSEGFQVFVDERYVAGDLIVWEDVTDSYYLQLSPVKISFPPLTSYSGAEFFLIGGKSYAAGKDTSISCFRTIEFAVQMENIYRSVKPIVMVGDKQLETFEWDESTGLYRYAFEVVTHCQVSVALDENSLVLSLERGEGVTVSGFNFGKAYVSSQNKFHFTVSLDDPSKYALIYVDGALLSIPKEAGGIYKVGLQNIISDKLISIQVSNTPPLGINPLPSASAQISATEGSIHIYAPSPLPLSIYTLTGKEKIRQTASGSHQFSLPQGTYIVQAGSATQKILVR